MIAGQVVDLKRREKVTADTLKYIHDHKTGSLHSSILAGIIWRIHRIIFRSTKKVWKLSRFGFSVVDDIWTLLKF